MIDMKIIKQITTRDKLKQLLQSEYDSDYALFIKAISKSINRLYRVSITDADTYLSFVINCFKYIPKEYHDKLFAMRARLALWNAEYTTSLKFYSKALSHVVGKRDFHAAAMIRKGMVEVYMYLSRYDEGIQVGKEALRYFNRKKMTSQAGQVMTNIGNIYHRMDKNRLALMYYDKAKEIFIKDGGVACAIVDFNRANIHTNMNELARAKKLYLEAGQFYKKANMELAYQQTEYSIAYLLFLESKYSDAFNLFEKVYDSLEILGDKTTAAITQLDLAELNLQLNQYGSAVMLSELIIPIFKKYKMPYEEGKACYFAAIAKLELGDITQAKKLLLSSQKIFIKEKNNLWLGMIQSAYNALYCQNKKYTKALEASELAITYYKKSKDIRREHDADISYIQALFLSKNEKRAFAKLRKLLENNITLEQQRKVHELVGEYYFSKKKFAIAIVEFKKAIVIVEKMMQSLHYDEIKFFFVADKFKMYTRLVECTLQLGEVEKSYLRQMKALSLVNEQFISTKSLEGNVPDKILSQIDSLRYTLSVAYKYPQKGKRVASGSQDILKYEKRLWHLEQKSRAYLKNENRTIRASANTYEMYAPSHDEAVIHYFVSDNSIGLFVQTIDGVKYIDLRLSLDELKELVRKIQFLFEQSIHRSNMTTSLEIKKAYLQKLYRLLIAPILLDEKIKTLSIIPDSVFNQIPFITLCDEDGGFIKDRYKVNIIADPKSLHAPRIEKTDFSKLKNSIFSVSHESLPLVDIEGEKIHRQFKKSTHYKANKASRMALTKEFRESTGFIHIAAHASRSSENPLFSRIMFSDGVLFPFDFIGNGIEAKLVTLSGCQTAAPGLNYGNTFSLAKTFYRAGSRFVLASLWPVDDRVTMLFMNEFYTQLSQSKNIKEAYRKAIQYISLEIEDPAYWGAFILIGN